MSEVETVNFRYISPPKELTQCPECGYGRHEREFNRPTGANKLVCGSCFTNWERLKRGDKNEKTIRKMAEVIRRAIAQGSLTPTVGNFGNEVVNLFQDGLKTAAQVWHEHLDACEPGSVNYTRVMEEFRKLLACGQQEARADMDTRRMTSDEMVKMLKDFAAGGEALALGFENEELSDDFEEEEADDDDGRRETADHA